MPQENAMGFQSTQIMKNFVNQSVYLCNMTKHWEMFIKKLILVKHEAEYKVKPKRGGGGGYYLSFLFLHFEIDHLNRSN